MSATTTFYCDRCAREIPEDRPRNTLKPTEGAWKKRGPIDLCGNCFDGLLDWLGDPEAPTGPVPAPKPDAPGDHPRRRKSAPKAGDPASAG